MNRSAAGPSLGVSLGHQVLLASFLGLLLCGRQIASWTNARNRYLLHWQRADSLALALAVLLLSVVVFLAGRAFARHARARGGTLHHAALLVVFAAGLLAQFSVLSKARSVPLAVALWIVAAALIWLAWRRWHSRAAAACARIGLVMSPLVPMLLVQMLLWRGVDVREHSPLQPPVPTAGRTPIVIVVFDEWSRPRSVVGDEFAPFLPNLRALAERSIVESAALAPSHTTRISLPRLLYQRGGEVKIRSDAAYLVEGDHWTPARGVPSVFDRARTAGYRSTLLGYYFPYRDLVGDEVDHVVSFSHEPKGATLAATLGMTLARNVQYWTDPVSQAVWPRLYARLYSENWREINQRLRAELLSALRQSPDGAFIVGHLPMPHAPFIFDERGRYLGPFERDRMSGTPEEYERHLRYADTVLGEIVSTMTEAGTFDRALVVVTADHSWKKEPDPAIAGLPDAERLVPLVVKWPGQREALRFDEPFCTARLAPVLEAVLAGAPPPIDADLWTSLTVDARTTDICRSEDSAEGS